MQDRESRSVPERGRRYLVYFEVYLCEYQRHQRISELPGRVDCESQFCIEKPGQLSRDAGRGDACSDTLQISKCVQSFVVRYMYSFKRCFDIPLLRIKNTRIEIYVGIHSSLLKSYNLLYFVYLFVFILDKNIVIQSNKDLGI
ncbi:uncharacterized protein LOC116851825 isoform X1 [Odontomachus brunneus]|uniref:uncharacterized protein LOC116851825 isoform X1 n=1 Tax=Odontomachus brunneus TaxID=486640 RepID=UPI0013F1E2F9|nr:uncharacterized protein LOC116851825 isoform X1 [Odontomachus brunneus]